jgi:hypothetical protein
MVSSNNGFLVSLGVIEGGNAKHLTPIGVRAALALDHPGAPEAMEAWTDVAQGNPDLERIVDAVRIRQGMDEDALLSHIVLSAGVPKTSRWLTGARTVVDILQFAGLVVENDGLFTVASAEDRPPTISGQPETGEAPTGVEISTVSRTVTRQGVVVNVHVWVTPADVDFDSLADDLKKFLAKLTTD